MTRIATDLPRLRPSSASRWLNCPESPHHTDDTTSEAAAEGTALHLEAEMSLRRCLNGTHPLPGESPSHPDPDVQFAVDDVWSMVEPGSRVMLESDVMMAAGHDLISGTADVVLLQPDRTIVCADFKFGVGIRVDADEDQLAVYAAGLLQMYKAHGFRSCRVRIIQPRHHRGAWLDEVTVTQEDARETVRRAKAAIRAIRRGRPPVAGDWCRWCPAKPVCPAWAQEGWEVFDELVP